MRLTEQSINNKLVSNVSNFAHAFETVFHSQPTVCISQVYRATLSKIDEFKERVDDCLLSAVSL